MKHLLWCYVTLTVTTSLVDCTARSAASNKARGEQHQAAIDTVLANMALHDKPERNLTGIVRNSLKAYKRKLKKKTGLRKVPCQTAVRRRIKRHSSTGVTH